MRRNILLFILVLVLSFATASYFGSLYNNFSPQHESTFWGLDTSDSISFVGFFVAYIFFVILIFGFVGFKRNKSWFIVTLIPPTLLWLGADLNHIYIPVFFGLAGFLLAKLINFIISKFRRANPPLVLK